MMNCIYCVEIEYIKVVYQVGLSADDLKYSNIRIFLKPES